jgi:hypothetical protein
MATLRPNKMYKLWHNFSKYWTKECSMYFAGAKDGKGCALVGLTSSHYGHHVGSSSSSCAWAFNWARDTNFQKTQICLEDNQTDFKRLLLMLLF